MSLELDTTHLTTIRKAAASYPTFKPFRYTTAQLEAMEDRLFDALVSAAVRVAAPEDLHRAHLVLSRLQRALDNR